MTTSDPRSQRLKDFGATFKPANVQTGQPYWAIVSADGPVDIGGNHHWYIDTLGVDGERVVGVPVEFFWDSDQQHVLIYSEAKPGEQQSLNLPLYAGGNAYGVRIVDGLPSDEIFGVGLGDNVPHHSFRTIYRRMIADTGTTPVDPPQTDHEALQAIKRIVDAQLGTV